MASKRSTADLLLEQTAAAGRMSVRGMFGEYALYCDGKVVGFICDDQLFVKPTAAGRAYLGTVVEGAPYPGAKPYFLLAGDAWEDADWLSGLIRASAADLPPPRVKATRAKTSRANATRAKTAPAKTVRHRPKA